jgi:hypothetical protein
VTTSICSLFSTNSIPPFSFSPHSSSLSSAQNKAMCGIMLVCSQQNTALSSSCQLGSTILFRGTLHLQQCPSDLSECSLHATGNIQICFQHPRFALSQFANSTILLHPIYYLRSSAPASSTMPCILSSFKPALPLSNPGFTHIHTPVKNVVHQAF